MNKKQIRKNIQKNKTTIEKEEKDNYFKFVTTLAAILIVFIVTYMLVGIFYTKEISFDKKEDKKEKQDITVDNSTIMLGQLFDQKESEYYAIIYDLDDKYSTVKAWLNVYKNKDNALTVYTVDSSKKFNSKYIVNKDSNPSAKKLDDLKIKAPTLVKISGGEIKEYIEGEDKISEQLKK